MHDDAAPEGLFIDEFYSEIQPKGKRDMAWELSSSGFLMTLSGYIPDLIEEDFSNITSRALAHCKVDPGSISHWCIHPGGKRILDAIHKTMQFKNGELQASYDVLKESGNLSSATILLVLKKMMEAKTPVGKLMGAALDRD